MKAPQLLLAFAILISTTVFAQSTGKNMGKINLSSFAFKGISAQYERQVAPRITVALGYSTVPTSTIAFKSLIEKQVNNSNVEIGNFRLGTSIFTPEVRYYFGKQGAFHGFYLAPYARIGKYNIEGPVRFSSTLANNRTAVFTGSLNTITGGLMMGSSFNLSKSLYLDWWILGASIGGANGNLNAAINLTPDEQISLKQQLDRVEIPFTEIQSEVNSKGASVTTTGNMAGIRGLGINLGIRF